MCMFYVYVLCLCFMCKCVIVNQFYEKIEILFFIFVFGISKHQHQLTIRFTESCFQNISYIKQNKTKQNKKQNGSFSYSLLPCLYAGWKVAE